MDREEKENKSENNPRGFCVEKEFQGDFFKKQAFGIRNTEEHSRLLKKEDEQEEDDFNDYEDDEKDTDAYYLDQQLQHHIRKAIEKEDLLPIFDKDIQISANDGIVTLRGVVFSEYEKKSIGSKAVAFAGFGNVINELEVLEDIEDLF